MTTKGSLPDASIRHGLKVSAHAGHRLPDRDRSGVGNAMRPRACNQPLADARAARHDLHEAGGSVENTSMNLSVVRLVCSWGLTITALPAASAATASQHNSTSG